MTFAELTETKGWKNFMAKLYGLGAAIVIVGALFKIMHWPGAGPMLVVGLLTEAVIFIFSAFEPLHEDLDWTLVYPELAGLNPEDEPIKPKEVKQGTGTNISIFDEKLLAGADNAPQLFEKLRSGLENLGQTATSLSDISNATVATNKYSESMNKASKSVENLSENVNNSSEKLNYSVDNLADAYDKSSEKVSKSTDELAESYQRLTESMKVDVDFSAVTQGNKSYNDSITVLNKNLSSLNAVFELQLEGGMEAMMDNLNETMKETEKYRSEVTKLGQRLEALNTVYGNILSAMNVKPNA